MVHSNSADVALRQRHVPSLPSTTELTTSDCSDNGSIESDRSSEYEFDTNVTTLDSKTAEELAKTTQNLPHDAALDKLKEIGSKTPILPSQIGTDFSFKRKIVWTNAFGFLLLHLCALIGIFLGLLGFANYKTLLYSEFDRFVSLTSPTGFAYVAVFTLQRFF